MDDVPLTRSYLETLTSRELVKWADYYGLDIPPGLDRIFVIDELLEIIASDAGMEDEYTEEPLGKFPASAALPKQYNITFIETLVRDPLWAFVFWEVKGADREIFEKNNDFSGYYLKVSPWGRASQAEAFTVPLAPEDKVRYLGFPQADETGSEGERFFTVELFARLGEEETLLAATNPFRLPALSPRIEKRQSRISAEYPLLGLSGMEDFPILRNGDRRFRARRGGNSVGP